MDTIPGSAYSSSVLGRLVAIAALLAMTAVATMASVHAARVGAGLPRAIHAGEMAHASGKSHRACADRHDCSAAEAGSCNLVCAGLMVILTTLPSGAEAFDLSPRRTAADEANHASRTPGTIDRPPKTRLL